MKDKLFFAFRILCVVILLAKVSNWIFHYSDQTNEILNGTMFSLIGIAYIAIGLAWIKKWVKFTLVACGLYLIAMNFFNEYLAVVIIGIVCLIVPMVIARVVKDVDDEANTIAVE